MTADGSTPATIYVTRQLVYSMNRYLVGVLSLLCCTVLFAGGIAATDAAFGVEIAGSIDTPDREVTVEGDQYTVSAIGVVDPGEPIEASIDAPENTSYDVYLYDEDRRAIEVISDAGATATFDGDYSTGSYVVAVWVDGNVRAVHPVVVRSYEVTVDAPAEVEPDTQIEFAVNAETVPGTPENLDTVQVVVSNDGDERELTATETSDGSYTVTTTLSEAGDYLVYANVRGSDSARGEKILLGVSRSTTVTVQDSTPTSTTTATDAGGSGGDETPTTTSTSTDTATPSDTSTATATTTPTETPTATDPSTPATQSATSAENTATSTPTPSNVLTPNGSSTTETTGSLSVLLPLGALLGFGFLVHRQH